MGSAQVGPKRNFCKNLLISRIWLFGLAMAAMLLASCSGRKADNLEEPIPAEWVWILDPAVSNSATIAAMNTLKELYPKSRVVAPHEAAQALDDGLREGRILVIPAPAFVPMELWAPLTEYIEWGGRAVFLGADPFRERVSLTSGGYQAEEEYFRMLAPSAWEAPDFSSIQRWAHQNNSGKLRGAVRLARDFRLPWPAVQVEVAEFDRWDGMALDAIPEPLCPSGENALAFYSFGGESVSRLVVECEQEDGSRWAYVQPLSPEWRLCVAHEARFRRVGAVPPGRTASRFELERVRKISIGLNTFIAPQAPGNRRFGVSDVRLLKDLRDPAPVANLPDVFLASPPYRSFDVKTRFLRMEPGGEKIEVYSPMMQSSLPRGKGWGGDAADGWRWIPLCTARDSGGAVLGWPASMAFNVKSNGVVAMLGWIGIQVSGSTREPVKILLHDCLWRMGQGLFLYRAGCDRSAYASGETLEVSARWRSSGAILSMGRIMAELLTPEGHIERRVVSPPTPYGEPVRLSLGVIPPVRGLPEDRIVRIQLLDAKFSGRSYDRLDQPIKFMSSAAYESDAPRIKASGTFFSLGNKPLFIAGINYAPFSAVGRRDFAQAPHWLDVSAFDPDLVRRDLDQAVKMGLSAVAIQYLEERQAPQLLYFLDEARRRDLWVQIFVAGLSPEAPDLEKAGRMIRAAHLKEQAQVYALEMAWAPHLGNHEARKRWDADWESWLVEQYGSVEHAGQAIGFPIWREAGAVTGPPDVALISDGPHRAAVAVYRRFADDWFSRRCGHIRRFLRALGCSQLLTLRSACGGPSLWGDPSFPVDLASGAVHLDFLSPVGWGLYGTAEQFYQAGFIAAYARGISDGKPVAWMEFGASVGESPQEADEQNQARIFQNMLSTMLKSKSAAGFAWWYPAGLRIEDWSDFGLVLPTGDWRPAARAFRDFAHRVRLMDLASASWRGREFSRSMEARGLTGLWERWRNTYRDETAASLLQEFRPAGFGKLTTDMLLASVGGLAYDAPAPLECANAEWGSLWIEGKDAGRAPGGKLSMKVGQNLAGELINTGPASWAASQPGKERTVWLRAEHPGLDPRMIPMKSIPYGQVSRISWMASDAGAWTLRPWLFNSGGFGEPLFIEVEPAPEPEKNLKPET